MAGVTLNHFDLTNITSVENLTQRNHFNQMLLNCLFSKAEQMLDTIMWVDIPLGCEYIAK